MAVDLSGLFAPRSIAFVGGSRARLAAAQTRQFGFEGDVWEVNPNGPFPTLADLPSVPDAVFIGVPAEAAGEVMSEAAALGVKGAVAYPADFAEAGHVDRQAALVRAAGEMPFIGPNCHGFVNPRTGAVLWPDVHGCDRVESGVAIITQSGNVAIDLTMQQRGLPVAMVITLGNQASVDLVDCLEAMVADPAVTAIGLHIEGLTDSARFADACRAAHAAGKGVAVLKTGTSHQGAVIANTHTASLAGSASAHRALFERCGAVQVHAADALVGALSVLHATGPLRGASAVSLSCSGGEASLMADLSNDLRVEFPPFSEPTKTVLDSILDGKVALENPFDYHTFIWGDADRMTSCFTSALSDGADIGILVIDFPNPGRDNADWWPTVDAFADAVRRAGVTGVVTSTLPENLPEDVCEYVTSLGLAPLPGMSACVAVLDALIPRPIGVPHLPPPVRVSAAASILDEATAKTWLRGAGLPVPHGRQVHGDTADSAAADIGFPVVVKSLAVAHRTEVGGVAIDLNDESEVATAVASMRHLGPQFLVEQMVQDTVVELLVGIQVDEPVGWTLTLGSGGVLAELVADTATLLLPCTAEEIDRALGMLAADRLLNGYRGGQIADRPAAIEAIHQLTQLAAVTNAHIEINPLIVTESGAIIADALIELPLQQPSKATAALSVVDTVADTGKT